VTLKDKQRLTRVLLKSGAGITEINTVRKHISDLKGGWLAKKAFPATVLNLVISDVVGDAIDSIASGPTAPDSTTFSDAIMVLDKYGLWNKTPSSIREILSDGKRGLEAETPKPGEAIFERVYNVVLGNCRSAAVAACRYLKAAGCNTLLLTSALEGEARSIGAMLGLLAHDLASSSDLLPRPAAVVAAGETTVTVVGKGMGGRNQELVLAAASMYSGVEGVAMASLCTDGVDGPTDAAGAIADGSTLARAAKLDLKPEACLSNNDSYTFFSRIGDLICTGPTGTNVNDISVIVIL
jgi:glycerate-2-kinase